MVRQPSPWYMGKRSFAGLGEGRGACGRGSRRRENVSGLSHSWRSEGNWSPPGSESPGGLFRFADASRRYCCVTGRRSSR